MAQRIAIVTGANSGMGLETTIQLARQGFQVVMACRSMERGRTALEEAKQKSGQHSIRLMLCDLGSLASVRQFAEQFLGEYSALDVLVNNAGVITVKRHITTDGFEAMIGVNHLGHFLLTHLLLPALLRAPQGRIVVVSSAAHKAGSIHFDDPHLKRGFHVVKGYAQSKLANLLFTRELALRLAGGSVTVNALHPGAVATNFGVNRDTGFGRSVYKLLRPFFRTPAQGAATILYLAVAEEVSQTNGFYYYDNLPIQPSAKALDAEEAKRLWTWSEQAVGLESKIQA